VLTVTDGGEALFEERTRTAEGSVAGVAQYRFTLRAPVRAQA
jgi:hypothetical protein